jgi:hypothetical protein
MNRNNKVKISDYKRKKKNMERKKEIYKYVGTSDR